MNPRKQARKRNRHLSNLAFLWDIIRNSGPVGYREGRRFNFLVPQYHRDILGIAETHNPEYYTAELLPILESPSGIPQRINPLDLLVPCLPTQEDRFWIATLDWHLSPLAFELFRRGYSQEEVIRALDEWAWL